MPGNKKNKRLLDEYFKSRFDQASVETDEKLWGRINTKLKSAKKSNNRYGIVGFLGLLFLLTTTSIAYLYFNNSEKLTLTKIVNDKYEHNIISPPLKGENAKKSFVNKNNVKNSDQTDENISLINKDLQEDEQTNTTLPAQFIDDEKNNDGFVLSVNNENNDKNDNLAPHIYNKLKIFKNKKLNYQFSINIHPADQPGKKEIDDFLISSGFIQNKKWSFELSAGPVHIQPLMKWNIDNSTDGSESEINALIGYEGGFYGRYYLNNSWYVQSGIKVQYYSTDKELFYKTKQNDTTYVSKEYDSLIFYPKISLARFEKAWKEEQIISQTELLNSQISSQKLISLSMPLMIGYEIQMGNFITSVESGIAFTRLINAEADVLNSDSSAIITYTHNDEDLPYRKNTFGILSRFSLNYQIHNFWAITVNPYVYLNLHEPLSSSGFVEYKGVSVGLRYFK